MSLNTPWDHLFALVVFVLYPIYAWKSFPGYAESVRKRGEPAKVAGYRETILEWLAFLGALTLLWTAQGRDPAILGLQVGSLRGWILGGLLAAVMFGLYLAQWRGLLRQPDARKQFEEAGDLTMFLPRTRRELRWFSGVSVNAGVTEELIYRGFLIAYLEPIVGTIGACVLVVVAFTLGHYYQGLAALTPIAVASVFMVAIYVVSGTIWLPILVHAVMDLLQGRFVFELLSGTNGESLDVAAEPS